MEHIIEEKPKQGDFEIQRFRTFLCTRQKVHSIHPLSRRNCNQILETILSEAMTIDSSKHKPASPITSKVALLIQ